MFKKGDKVRIFLRGAGFTTSEDTAKVVKVSKGKVYTDESDTPYSNENGMWDDNGVVCGFTRWIEKA